MNNDAKIILSVSFFSILLIAVFLWLSQPPKSANTDKSAQLSQLLGQHPGQTRGNPQAKVHLVEFADIQCPACATYAPDIDKFLTDYQDKVFYTYKHYPLPQHLNAIISAQAAQAAGLQGKFFQLQSLLFVKQSDWSEQKDPVPMFLNYAKQLNLDLTKFQADLNSQPVKDAVINDTADGNTLGVDSTPTFLINGLPFAQAPNYANLKKEVDKMLQ